MSRAINLTLNEADVVAKCNKDDIAISVTGPLASGGTRLVCRSSEAADKARSTFSKHIIQGPVKLFPLRTRSLRL